MSLQAVQMPRPVNPSVVTKEYVIPCGQTIMSHLCNLGSNLIRIFLSCGHVLLCSLFFFVVVVVFVNIPCVCVAKNIGLSRRS